MDRFAGCEGASRFAELFFAGLCSESGPSLEVRLLLAVALFLEVGFFFVPAPEFFPVARDAFFFFWEVRFAFFFAFDS